MTMPEFEARRCTRTGPNDGRCGGPAGRFPRSRATWVTDSGFGRTRSSSRVWRSKNINVSGSIRIPT
jgi:hypothetical protein